MATLAMMAVRYESPTRIVTNGYAFDEVIAPGALAPALARKEDVVALMNHDPNRLLGRTASRTLKLRHLPQAGLEAEVSLPSTGLGEEVRELVARRDISGASFGFVAGEESWYEGRGGRFGASRRSTACST